MDNEYINYLERIAIALERIADSIEGEDVKLNVDAMPASEDDEKTTLLLKPNSIVCDYLSERDVVVKTIPEETEADEVLDSIAQFMGTKYNNISEIYSRLKRNLYSGGNVRVDMKNWEQENVSYSCQLCNMLYRYAMLSSYKYLKSPHFILNASVNRVPTVINFLTGHWLERFVKSTIENELKTIDGKGIEYSYLLNPQIQLPNGDDFELDILFVINGTPLWIEAKTGDYQNYVDKYSKVANVLGVDKENSLLVLTQIDTTTATQLGNLFDMTIVPISAFVERLKENIARILSINND